MGTLISILGLPNIATGAVGLIGLAFGWLKRRQQVKQWRLDRAVECLEAGIRETYEEYVRARKSANLDGHLTDAERREARLRATEYAKKYAAQDGVNLLKTYAAEYIPVIIDRIVQRKKRPVAQVDLDSIPGM